MNSYGKQEHTIKLIFVGDCAVGKTSLIRAFQSIEIDNVSATVVPTDIAVQVTNSYNMQVTLNIWDTAGQEQYRSVTPMFFRSANFAIVCFEIAERVPESVEKWISLVQEFESSCKVVLVGTKKDLVRDSVCDMTRTNAEALIGAGVAINYFSTSAKTNYGVDELFGFIADQEQVVTREPVTGVRVEPRRVEEQRSGCCD